jgi:magnesium-transporting ATPase (P-type)
MYSLITGVGVALVPSLVALICRGNDGAAAAYFVSLVITLVLYMYTTRSPEFFYKRILHNRFLGIASIVCIALAIIIAATPLNVLFGLNPAEGPEWLTAILLPFAVPLVFEALKFFKIYINK